MSRLPARSLIMDLLVARRGMALSSREAVRAGRLFSITPNAIRTALARLSAAELVSGDGHGNYRVGARATELTDELRGWRQLAERVVDWRGAFVAVHTGALPRTDRPALRARERALAMTGFRELERGLFLRPDNLADGVVGTRYRMRRRGLDANAPLFVASSFDDETYRRILGLWRDVDLNERYREMAARIDAWLAQRPGQALEAAAHDVFLLGREALRAVVFDPLLPPPLVDVALRAAFVRRVVTLDDEAQRIWDTYLTS